MMDNQNGQALLQRIDALDKAMSEFRKAESNIKSLKADVAKAHIQHVLSGPERVSTAELSRHIETYLAAW